MKLTDFYLMEELKPIKSHRLDCTASTGEYEPFEDIAQRSRNKRFFCYLTNTPDQWSAAAHRKAETAITNGKQISGVIVPDLDNPLMAYGDTKGTNDALLFQFGEDYKRVEIYVARGMKHNSKGLYRLFVDGELDDEVKALKQRVKP